MGLMNFLPGTQTPAGFLGGMGQRIRDQLQPMQAQAMPKPLGFMDPRMQPAPMQMAPQWQPPKLMNVTRPMPSIYGGY